MHRITDMRVLSGYRVWLRFADGAEGDVVLSDLAGRGVFAAWNDRGFFESAHSNTAGALEWGSDLDLCPDSLYLRLTGKTPEEMFPALAAEHHA